MFRALTFVCLTAYAVGIFAAEPPQAEISNQQLKVRLYLPDAQNGFYRSTRFDWSGAIASLEYKGHNFYGPWFTKYDPTVRDFVYKDGDIIVGAESGMTGPSDEFSKPLGYDLAKPGGTFVKVGVGVLRKVDTSEYASFKKFEVVDSGKWTIGKGRNYIEFTQELHDTSSGYGYLYRKTIRLAFGKPEMTIEHSLKNTGTVKISTNVYNHNFLVLDKSGPTPDLSITLPFEIRTPRPPAPELAAIHGKQILYKKTLQNEERVFFPIEGFSENVKDYDIRIEQRRAGVGMRITGDRPLSRATLWSIRSVMAIEPFVDVVADPGKAFEWKYTYTFYSPVH